MNNYYVDTNIWIDFWEDRSDGLRPLGEFAFRFFKHAMENKELVFYSELVFEELRTKFKAELIEEHLFRPFRDVGILRKAEISRKQMEEAMNLSTERHVPKGDALHAILARDNNAVLVSRDSHYEIIQKFIKAEVRKPEELY